MWLEIAPSKLALGNLPRRHAGWRCHSRVDHAIYAGACLGCMKERQLGVWSDGVLAAMSHACAAMSEVERGCAGVSGGA